MNIRLAYFLAAIIGITLCSTRHSSADDSTLSRSTNSIITTNTPGTAQKHAVPFPMPAVILHQPEQQLAPRVKDYPALADFIKQIQAICESYFSDEQPRSPQTIDVVVVIKPGLKSHFWLGYELPKTDDARDKDLVEKLQCLKSPPVEQGPVSFTIRLLLWGATEPDSKTTRSLFFPQAWKNVIGTNAVMIPDGILPLVWPDK